MVFTACRWPADVEQVALGANGLIRGQRPDTAFFEYSTNSVALVRKITRLCRENLYCSFGPVSGGPRVAAAAKMAIWVWRRRAMFNRHKPVLDSWATHAADRSAIRWPARSPLVHNCTIAGGGGARRVFTDGDQAGSSRSIFWRRLRQGAPAGKRTFDRLGRFLSSSTTRRICA